MARYEIDIEVPAAPDAVWAAVEDFGDLSAVFPGIEVRLEGDVRVIAVGDGEIREQLLARDELGKRIRYSVVGGRPDIEHHEAQLSIGPGVEGSVVTWSWDVMPDEVAKAMLPVYTSGLENLRSHFS
jgi:carbon monoxide dehydrogenase subunit G